MATGGLVLKEAPEPRQGVGLVVDYVGQYNEHAAGKKAGFKKGDVFLSAGGEQAHDREPVLRVASEQNGWRESAHHRASLG